MYIFYLCACLHVFILVVYMYNFMYDCVHMYVCTYIYLLLRLFCI